jgi:hypothetical protein
VLLVSHFLKFTNVGHCKIPSLFCGHCLFDGGVLLTFLAFGLISDLICRLFSVLVLIWDGKGGTVHASADWPPTPHDVRDGV